MKHYAAIDVSLELSSVCIVDAAGKVVKESKVETHPDALVKSFKDVDLPLTLIGLEAGPLSQWLHAGLTEAGSETVLMETRHVKKALFASTIKSDRQDARGMAQLLRMGWFQPVHAKSAGSQEVRALLVARKQLQHKLTDIELSIRGILRGFGLKVGKVAKTAFEKRIRELVTGHAMLEQIAEAMLSARITLLIQFNKLHKDAMGGRRPAVVCQHSPSSKSLLDFKEISEMDRVNTATSPPDRLYRAMELSKNSWLLGIQFPDRQKASVYPIKGGDSEGLMAKLFAACDHWTKVSGKKPSIILCYEAGYAPSRFQA